MSTLNANMQISRITSDESSSEAYDKIRHSSNMVSSFETGLVRSKATHPDDRGRPERQRERVRVEWVVVKLEERVHGRVGSVVEDGEPAEEADHGHVLGDRPSLRVGGHLLAVLVQRLRVSDQ